MMLQVVETDNYARENRSDRLVVICSDDTAQKIVDLLNRDPSRYDSAWYKVQEMGEKIYKFEP